MSTEPTPENLRGWADSLHRRETIVFGPDSRLPSAEYLRSAADRIEALERIVRTRVENSGLNPLYGLSDADADLLRSIIEADR